MNRIVICTTLGLAATPLITSGADISENPNRFSLGPRIGMNFKADFRHNPTLFTGVPASNPGAATGGVDHTYDDGYVRLDSSANAGGLTWNWGYQNSSQVAGDSLQFHSAQANPAFGPSNKKVTDDPQYGVELTYQRVLGNIGSSGRWGLEAGFGYTDLDVRGNTSGAGSSSLITDTFQLNGVLPPGAGYTGTFAGPGALISDFPTRTIASDAMTSREKLSGQLFGIRLGPFVEWNFTPQFSLAASAGFTLAPAFVDYDFTETTRNAAGGTSVARGHSSKTELLYGPFVSAMLRYDFNEHWGVFLGAQFQRLNDLRLSSGDRSARLDQGATLYGTGGVTYRF